MKVIAIIPARYASTRFPGKPLVKIGNKSMIQLVYGQVQKANEVDEIYIATDDKRIFSHARKFTDQVQMTAINHASGTDRIAEVAASIEGDIFLNVQGDEPFIHPDQIDQLARTMKTNDQFEITTLAKKIEDLEELFNPNVVKLVKTNDHRALYFSRHPIPYVRGKNEKEWLSYGPFFKHIGMYAFKKDALMQIAKLNQSHLEKAESLEQLRWLENGFNIGVGLTKLETKGIDTPEDLEALLKNY